MSIVTKLAGLSNFRRMINSNYEDIKKTSEVSTWILRSGLEGKHINNGEIYQKKKLC